MPSKGTRVRAVRIDDSIYLPAKAQADKDGTDIPTLIRTWLTVYGRPRKSLPTTVRNQHEPQRRHASP